MLVMQSLLENAANLAGQRFCFWANQKVPVYF